MENKINPIDKENLRQVFLDFPRQFEIGFKLAENIKLAGNFNSVCVSGMGGSSLPADILETYTDYLREKNPEKNKAFRIFKNRGYKLPFDSKEKCLHFFSSYSGNTEETLESLNEAIENKIPCIGLTNGGKLMEICQKNSIPFIRIPNVSQPRCATGYFFSILLQILSNCGLIEESISKTILESVERLEKDTRELEEKGKEIAQKISGKTPVIHTAEKIKSIGRIGKIKINEDSKTPCFFNYYPELNHNEMVGYTLPQGKFFILTLVDKKEHPQIIKRMEITNKLLEQKGLETMSVEIPDDSNFFLSLFSTLALLDWISYYLALTYNQDPTPVDMVEDLKKMLK